MQSVVFFGAHADDVELGAGGTCAKVCALGYDVHIVILTDENDRATAAQRRDEQVAASTQLGVRPNKVHFLGFPDGRVRCNKNTVRAARQLFKSMDLAPVAVFTHTEFDSHNDHVEATKIVKSTFRKTVILKYQVQNSALTTGFAPSIYCDVDPFTKQKCAALLAHDTQVAAGRIDLGVVERFARRFAVHARSEQCEAFELDLQEGATAAGNLLSELNASAFNTFWSPLLSGGRLAIVAGASAREAHCDFGRSKPVESDLLLITRLQGHLLSSLPARLGTAGMPRIEVYESNGFGDDAFFALGNVLVIGGPTVNPAASRVLNCIQNLRFRMDGNAAAAGAPGDRGIFDNRTGQVVRPCYRSCDGTAAGMELVSDYGLLTLALNPFASSRRKPRYIIGAMGLHAAGKRAAVACLLEPKNVGLIMAQAQRVFEGEVTAAQWLIRCNGDGAGFGQRNIRSYAANMPVRAGRDDATPERMLIPA